MALLQKARAERTPPAHRSLSLKKRERCSHSAPLMRICRPARASAFGLLRSLVAKPLTCSDKRRVRTSRGHTLCPALVRSLLLPLYVAQNPRVLALQIRITLRRVGAPLAQFCGKDTCEQGGGALRTQFYGKDSCAQGACAQHAKFCSRAIYLYI